MRHPVDYPPSQDFGENPTRNLPADHWIIQRFGNYQPDGHTGIDYPCPSGTPVRAVSDGIVVHVGWYRGTYADNPFWIQPGFAGWCYVVQHDWGFGIYGHCLENGARVKVGQRVTEGQILGLSGNTGASTGDHLHFEVLLFGYVLNGYMYGRSNPATLIGGSITPQGTITPLEEDVPNTPLELEQAALNVITVNPTVMGGRSLVQGVNQALLGIDVVNSNIAQLQTFVAQKLAPEAGVRDEGETYYLKGDEKPEVYALDVASGKLRHVQSAEFDVVTAIGIYKTVPQAKVDALLGGK